MRNTARNTIFLAYVKEKFNDAIYRNSLRLVNEGKTTAEGVRKAADYIERITGTRVKIADQYRD